MGALRQYNPLATAITVCRVRAPCESFDRQFIKDMVKDHKEDVARYEKESHKTGPAADYAKQTLPKLRAHLKMAEDLQSSEHVASASQSSKMKTR